MENELQLLHTIDKGGLRVSRVKTSAAVKSSEESPAVAQAFESAFLSRPQEEEEVYTAPPNPCTKTGELLRLLEASHRKDRRRLHEDDECCEEDVGDRRRDGPVGDVIAEACVDTVDGVATALAARRTLK